MNLYPHGIPTAANDPRWNTAPVDPRRPMAHADPAAARRWYAAERRACALTVELGLAQIRAQAAGRLIPASPLT